MSAVRFDVRAFVDELGAELRKRVPPADFTGLTARIVALEDDAVATLEALKTEQDPERRLALRVDLETYLPDRKKFIMSAAESRMSGAAAASFEAALDVTIRVLVATAKALSPIPLP